MCMKLNVCSDEEVWKHVELHKHFFEYTFDQEPAYLMYSKQEAGKEEQETQVWFSPNVSDKFVLVF